jgi:ribosomal protein L12E/L44/L45/RPP1/RPP2
VVQVLSQLGPVMKQLSGVDLENLLQNISRLPGAVADNLDSKGSKG